VADHGKPRPPYMAGLALGLVTPARADPATTAGLPRRRLRLDLHRPYAKRQSQMVQLRRLRPPSARPSPPPPPARSSRLTRMVRTFAAYWVRAKSSFQGWESVSRRHRPGSRDRAPGLCRRSRGGSAGGRLSPPSTSRARARENSGSGLRQGGQGTRPAQLFQGGGGQLGSNFRRGVRGLGCARDNIPLPEKPGSYWDTGGTDPVVCRAFQRHRL
jgi:hypothetical protein